MSGNRKRKRRFATATATPAAGAAAAPQPARPEPKEAMVFSHDAELRQLEGHVYEHVFQAINFGEIGSIETQLYCLLTERDIPEDAALDLSKLIVTRAIERTCDDLGRYLSFVPEGITDAERKAVEFDESCPFCEAEAESAAYLKAHAGDHAHVEEACACCDDMARSWRAEHRETLRKHGLAPPETVGD